ncbi:ABC transporter ATP-binding protein [candidate division FCPU426 bacterium]|nr:ABC transporter ATP-binding protein [candidate division FCPU426 bacterium]
MVQASNLTVRFGSFTAVDNISFAVQGGEIFGFLGANGAGKTTTIRVLCGLLVPSKGEASVAGISCTTAAQQVKTKIGYMSQRFTLYNDLSVAENLAFTAALRKLTPAQLSSRTRALFDFIDFRYSPEAMVQSLPGGIKQQLALVAAMLHDPEVIFLDEPTAGVAPSVRAKFWGLIGRLAKQGKTIFVTTHYLDEAEQCHRIALMRDGKIIALDSPSRLKKTAFPEPLLEIDLPQGASRERLENLKLHPQVARMQPYGRRYHVLVLKPAAWKTIAGRFPKSYRIRRIDPTLEDVFIRLVEGERLAERGAEKSEIES